MRPEDWGPLFERYRSPAPRKLLALDGGGIRVILSLAILRRMEALLAKATGRGADFRLCDYFDYIAGTSTGAIIAAGLARGWSCEDLIQFFQVFGPQMFQKQLLLLRLQSLYTADPLKAILQQRFGKDTTLRPEDLRTLLLVVTRNVTTDSPWPISSNPDALFNDTSRSDCNLRIPIWQLVRASTALPVYFPPEVVNWDPNDASKSFVFVDGGVTPYNNPAFLLYRMAVLPPYRLNFQTGERNLLLVSVGTGAAAAPGAKPGEEQPNILAEGSNLPSALMYAVAVDQDISCRSVGRCTYGARIDRELGDMIDPAPLSQDLGQSFLYARYNAELTAKGLEKLGCGDLDPKPLWSMDGTAPENLKNLERVGDAAGTAVRLDHFGPFVP